MTSLWRHQVWEIISVFRKCHILKPILHAWDLILAKNGHPVADRESFELSENVHEKSIIFFINEITRDKDKRFSLKVTKTKELSVKLLDYPWISGVQ